MSKNEEYDSLVGMGTWLTEPFCPPSPVQRSGYWEEGDRCWYDQPLPPWPKDWTPEDEEPLQEEVNPDGDIAGVDHAETPGHEAASGDADADPTPVLPPARVRRRNPVAGNNQVPGPDAASTAMPNEDTVLQRASATNARGAEDAASDPICDPVPLAPPARVRPPRNPVPGATARAQHDVPAGQPDSMPQHGPAMGGEAEPEPAGTDGYTVGYGKPPKHTQFKKGQSGNPKGRKKGAKGIKTIVREVATERRPVRTAHGTRHMTTAEIIIHKAMEQAMKGNQRAVQLMLSLYQDAVPDRVEEAAIDAADDLSATDMAMLEAFIAMTRNDPRGASA